VDLLVTTLRVVLSLAAVLALIWAAQRYARRSARPVDPGDTITVVTRQGVGGKASVVMVEAAGHRFLLGVTEQHVNVLHTGEIPPPQPSTDDLFAHSLAGATGTTAATGTLAPPLTRQPARRDGTGAFLDPATWRQAREALRTRRAR
jgi:flagellar protein FliO/FliZ